MEPTTPPPLKYPYFKENTVMRESFLVQSTFYFLITKKLAVILIHVDCS